MTKLKELMCWWWTDSTMLASGGEQFAWGRRRQAILAYLVSSSDGSRGSRLFRWSRRVGRQFSYHKMSTPNSLRCSSGWSSEFGLDCHGWFWPIVASVALVSLGDFCGRVTISHFAKYWHRYRLSPMAACMDWGLQMCARYALSCSWRWHCIHTACGGSD